MCLGFRLVRVIMVLGILIMYDLIILFCWWYLVLYYLLVVFDYICIVYVIFVMLGMLYFIVREFSVFEIYCGIVNEMFVRYKFVVVV